MVVRRYFVFRVHPYGFDGLERGNMYLTIDRTFVAENQQKIIVIDNFKAEEIPEKWSHLEFYPFEEEEEAEILSFSVEASFDGTSTTSTDDTTSSIDYDGGSEFISVDTSTDISATDSGGTVFVVSTSEEEKVEPVPEPIDIEEEKEVLLEEIEEMEEELVELDPEEMEEGSILDGIFEEEEEIDDEPVIRDDIEKIPREEPEEE